MRNRSNKWVTIPGVFILMSALFYIVRFKRDIVASMGLMGHLAMVILIGLVYTLAYRLINEKDLPETDYYYFGDRILFYLPIIVFMAGLVIANKTVWFCVMGSIIVVSTCLAYGHVRAVDAAVLKKETRAKKLSPYLSGIKVGNLSKEQLMKIVESMKSDGDHTTFLRAFSLGNDEWVLSFPQGVSIDGFLDVLLEICMGIDEVNHPDEYSEYYDVTGYYQFIEGELEGKMLMFTCGNEYVFNVIDSQGISYVDDAPRKKLFGLFRKDTHHFIPTGETGQEFIPFDFKDAITRGAVVKQVRIENYG